MKATDVHPHPYTPTHAGGIRSDGLCNLCMEGRQSIAHEWWQREAAHALESRIRFTIEILNVTRKDGTE